MQEDKLVLECSAREYLRHMSMIWSSPLSDQNCVSSSSQFALPVLGYSTDTTVVGYRQIVREKGRKIRQWLECALTPTQKQRRQIRCDGV